MADARDRAAGGLTAVAALARDRAAGGLTAVAALARDRRSRSPRTPRRRYATIAGVLKPRLVRYAGFAGAVLLAVAAYLGGALPDLLTRVPPVRIWRGENAPAILGTWLAGTALMTGAWWAARDRVPSARWAYVTAGLWLLPLLVAPALGSRDVYAYACQGDVYLAGHNPYDVSAADLPCQWLDTVSPVWRETPAPYGPLFVLIAGAAVAVGGSLTVTIALLRGVALAGVGLVAVFLPVLARRCGVAEGRALWLALACPLVGVHLVSGAHNDALMIGLVVAGLAVVSPRTRWHLVGGGALLGLAVLVKATAVVVVPFAALAAAVGPHPVRALVREGGLVVGGALAAVLGLTLGSGLGFGWIGALKHSGETVLWTSPSTAVGVTVNYAGRLFGAHLDAVPATRVVGMVALAVVLVVLWWQTTPGDARYGAGLALVATVALGPVFQPWYAIWPLAVLAATAGRIRWFAATCAVICFLVLPDGTGLARFTRLPGALAMTALVIALCVLAWRRNRPLTPLTRLPAWAAGPPPSQPSPGRVASGDSRG
jgi:alpha-1,6-mannosyltransferase